MWLMATAPPPPVRFETMIEPPRSFSIALLIRRFTVSVPPPAADQTEISTTRVGNSCAMVGLAKNVTRQASAPTILQCFIVIPPILFCDLGLFPSTLMPDLPQQSQTASVRMFTVISRPAD